MAEALAAEVQSLTLVTAGGWLPSGVQKVDLHAWYGVGPTFQIVRLPVYRRQPELFGLGNERRFTRAAALFARLKSPHLVYTRSKQAARYCANLGLLTILETHSEVDEILWRLRGAAAHPNLIGIVTVTEHLKHEYVEAGLPANKILVWSDGVDLRRFENLPSRDEARRQLDLPADRPIAMYCGHFYESKGVPCLIEAARHAPDVLFCLVGGWPDDIEQMRKIADGRDNICFLGFVANDLVPLHLSAADVLVLPNSARFEHAKATSPLKLFEYMAAKRPIVATRIPALAGFLRDGENSFLVEADSPADLARRIREAVSDTARRQQIAVKAAEEVRNFTWQRRATDILHHFGMRSDRAAA